jgi:hypothetical protein
LVPFLHSGFALQVCPDSSSYGGLDLLSCVPDSGSVADLVKRHS